MKRFNTLLIAATLTMSTCHMAVAQEQAATTDCAPRYKIVEILAEKYGETRQSIGLASNNTMMEMYASESTGTWTLMVTNAEGISCFLATGQHYENTVERLGPQGEKM